MLRNQKRFDVVNVQNNLDVSAGILTVRVAGVSPVLETDVNILFTFGSLAGGTDNLVVIDGPYATGGVCFIEANAVKISNVFSDVPEPAVAAAVFVIGCSLLVIRRKRNAHDERSKRPRHAP